MRYDIHLLKFVRYACAMVEFIVVPMKSNDCMELRIDFSMLTLTPSEARRLSNRLAYGLLSAIWQPGVSR